VTPKTPLTIVGGFLGAGKTTLLNHVLRHAGGRRLAVLVNDFGAVNVDAALIARRDGGILRLSNGCICCSIGDSFVDALVAVTRQEAPPDHVVIEASGVADPARIAELAYLDPAFSLQAVIVVADAERVRAQAADKYVGDTVRRQLEGADLVVLNKIDLCGESDRAAAAERLHELAPRARIIPASHAQVPIEMTLGFDAAHWGGFLQGSPAAHHPARTFASFTFEAIRPFSARKLRLVLDGLPPGVLRAKGFVVTDADSGEGKILHVVGSRWALSPGAPPGGDSANRIVVIGVADGLDEAGLRARLSEALVENGSHHSGKGIL
jgi:G3E family GTPase